MSSVAVCAFEEADDEVGEVDDEVEEVEYDEESEGDGTEG